MRAPVRLSADVRTVGRNIQDARQRRRQRRTHAHTRRAAGRATPIRTSFRDVHAVGS
jgi:hypothetical protein